MTTLQEDRLSMAYYSGKMDVAWGSSMTEEQIRAEGFRQAEASNLLEGLDSSGDVFYQALKARVICGELDLDNAIRLMVMHCKQIAKAFARENLGAV